MLSSALPTELLRDSHRSAAQEGTRTHQGAAGTACSKTLPCAGSSGILFPRSSPDPVLGWWRAAKHPLRSRKSICRGPISSLLSLLQDAYGISYCLVGAAESFSTTMVNSKHWDVMGVLIYLAKRRLHFLCSLQAHSSSAILNNALVPGISGTGRDCRIFKT